MSREIEDRINVGPRNSQELRTAERVAAFCKENGHGLPTYNLTASRVTTASNIDRNQRIIENIMASKELSDREKKEFAGFLGSVNFRLKRS